MPIGTKTAYTENPSTDVSSYSWSHTRAADSGLQVMCLIKSNSNPSRTVTSITFGSQTMTIQAQDKVDGVGRLICAVATLDPGVGPTGAQTVTVTLSGNDGRHFVGWAVDIADTGGAAGGAATSVNDGGATAVSVSYTPAVSGELLVAEGGCVGSNGSVYEGSGWTDEGTAESAITSSYAVEARLESKTAPDASAQIADVTFSASRTDRAIVVAGWKAAARGAMMMAA